MEEHFLHTNYDTFLTPDLHSIASNNLVVGFTTRNGGISKGPYESLNVGIHVEDVTGDVLANRRILGEQLGFQLETWVTAEQVHGNHIEKVTKQQVQNHLSLEEPLFKSCDGIYTKDRGILLATFYADCVPLYFFSPKASLIGLAHAGWKGTAYEIGKKMVDTWCQEEGILPEDIYVAIGPSIGACCYEVDSRVIDPIKKTIPKETYRNVFQEMENGKAKIDLKQANYEQMVAIGIPEKQILKTQYCTSCTESLFFSYRRDHGKTGRMMSFVGLKEV